MRWTPLWAFSVALLVSFAPAQEAEETQPEPRKIPPPIAEMQMPVRVPAKPTLSGGTKVWLRLADEVKVKQVKIGDSVNFVLYRDLYYRTRLLARAGSPVEASVQTVDQAKRLSRGSNVVIVFRGLKLLNGQVAPLTGNAVAKGGAGTGGHIASGLLDAAAHCNGLPCVLFDVPAVPTALVLAATSKGESRDVKVDTSAPAFVDGDFVLDLDTLQEPEQPSTTTGTVRIVRGVFGWTASRELYCNGIPLVRLDSRHKLELSLKPGYYRFSIRPRNDAMEIFVNAGSEINLLTDSERVYELNERDTNTNTRRFMGKRNAGKLLEEAKRVEEADRYGTECQPLAEMINP